ncbi:hypothetical protein J3L16_03440 [Alteromonas sp. 5E99-2]|uniref:hypothetical protein n=1 Tax=Alteromonas sp. 5E99-2 TaxID=2817683 RepID=UPI001A9997E9|nr:hypothetical protein [Alteromonas sp. 5E99-2]MBO1254739.1 hypothetical protein [Alteromonas sp. 5E99-2]
MKRYFAFSMAVIFILISSAIGLIWFSVESEPRITTDSIQYLNSADHVAPLLKQIQTILENPNIETRIDVTQTQISSIQGLIQRASNKFRAKSEIKSNAASINMTYAFTVRGVKRFINLQIIIAAGEGLTINKLKVGHISYSGWFAKFVAKHSINLYTKSNLATELLNSVEKITLDENAIQFKLKAVDKVFAELMLIDTEEPSERDKELQKYTALFLSELNNFHTNNTFEQLSLNNYINFVFKLAEENSNNNAVLVNEAAILSLAIFAGDSRLSQLFKNLSFDPENANSFKNRPTLADRTDLAQHFIISAALHVISRKNIALAIGEFKELMDRAPSGTGYSFLDLAADRAGVAFAEQATNNLKSAVILKRLSSGVSEDAYLPKLNRLSEGLHKQAFVDKYTQVDSAEYKKDVNLIKARIRTLSLYAEN